MLDALPNGVVAHQGGWDELAFVLLPISLFAVLLAVANRRANQQQDQQRADRQGDADEPDRAADE